MASISDFSYKKKLKFNTTVTGANVSSNQTNFPICVHINSSSWDTSSERDSFFGVWNVSGKRCQFYDSDGITELDYEVELYNATTQEAIYWVRVPQVDGNSTTDYVWVAYGNDPYGANQDNSTAVWNSYILVEHFQDTWSRYAGNPVLSKSTPGNWDDDHVNWPYVIGNDSTYYMYYMGNDEIGLATSNDGLAFTRITDGIDGTSKVLAKGGVGTWDAQHIASPAVVIHDGTWYMFYTGRNAGAEPTYECIGVATSADGKSWSKYGSNPILSYGGGGWRDRHLCHADIAWDADNNRWVMLVSGMSGGGHESIGRYYCTDTNFPYTWSEDAGNPVINYNTQANIDTYHAYQPRIYPSKVEGLWYVTYSADQSGTETTTLTICQATTSSLYDGSFTKSSNNSMFGYGYSSWEDHGISQSMIFKIGVQYNLYYAAADTGGDFSIGFATSPDIANSTREVIDSSSSANNGQKGFPRASPNHAAGQVGAGYSFNGSSFYIDNGSPTSLDNLHSADFTVSVYAYPTEDKNQKILDKRTSGEYGWFLGMDNSVGEGSSQTLQFGAYYSTTNARYRDNGFFTLNAWQHVGVVFSIATKTAIGYKNGTAIAWDLSNTPGVGTYDNDSSLDLAIGSLSDGSDHFWNGKLDELRIANVARSADWIKLEYYSMLKTNFNGDSWLSWDAGITARLSPFPCFLP